jgi:hypothetical protein
MDTVFLVCGVPLTSHYPVERATLSRARHAFTIAIPKARDEGFAPLLFRAPTQAVSDGPMIQRSRSLDFADIESRCIIVRVARLGMARRRVKEP